MIDFYSGQITDLINNGLRYNPEVQALSYAALKEKQRLIELARRTRTAAMIDELSEDILDTLAVELRSPYYSGDMTLEEKRAVVKNTLLWFRKAGTPAAVEELVAAVFGVGDVVEWFNSDPPFEPGTFDILTNAHLTEGMVNMFLAIIQKVKNTRSHLRRILISRRIDGNTYGAAAFQSIPNRVITNHTEKEAEITGAIYAGGGIVATPQITIHNTAPDASAKAEGLTIGGVAYIFKPHTTIGNHSERSATIKARRALGGLAIGARSKWVIINSAHIVNRLEAAPPQAVAIRQTGSVVVIPAEI